MAYVEEMQGVHYDELIGGTAVPVINKNVTLAAAAAAVTYAKGTLLSVDGGKYSPTATGGTAVAVLAADVAMDTADQVATVYVSGMFNRERLVAASGDTVDAHEEELRNVGIYLTSIKG